MKKNIFVLPALCAFIFVSCNSEEKKPEEGKPEEKKEVSAAKDIDYDEMAEGFCACMKPMYVFQKKLIKLLDAGDQGAVEALRDEAMSVQKEGEACIAALEAKYGVIEGEEQEAKATTALRKACPDIMALMEEGGEGSGE